MALDPYMQRIAQKGSNMGSGWGSGGRFDPRTAGSTPWGPFGGPPPGSRPVPAYTPGPTPPPGTINSVGPSGPMVTGRINGPVNTGGLPPMPMNKMMAKNPGAIPPPVNNKMPIPPGTTPKPPIIQGVDPNAQRDQYGNPINQYNATHQMPMIDGVPIGAYGAQWAGTTSFDPSTNPRAQQWMQWMQSFDPSAHWQHDVGSEGGDNGWQFQQDHPGAEGVYPGMQQALKPMGGGQTMENVFENSDWQSTGAKPHGYAGEIKDPNMMIHTPFGQITPTGNTKTPTDMWGTMGPAIIGGIATIMSGGAASPMLISLLSKAPGLLAQISSGNFNPAQLASMAGSYFMGGGGFGGGG